MVMPGMGCDSGAHCGPFVRSVDKCSSRALIVQEPAAWALQGRLVTVGGGRWAVGSGLRLHQEIYVCVVAPTHVLIRC